MTFVLEAWSARACRFSLAGLAAATVHCAALAWALYENPQKREDQSLDGTFVVEISTDIASPRIDRREVAIGIESDAVAPVDSSNPNQAQVAAPSVQPDEMTVPEVPAADPDDALSAQPREPAPEEVPASEPQEVSATEAPALAAVAASEASMRQFIENSQHNVAAPRSRAAGLSRQDRREIESWRRDLVMHINRFKRYPSRSRAAREQGTVEVTFKMDRKGRVLQSNISKSSGNARLDQAAIDILAVAAPLPQPPASIRDTMIELIVPVDYRWRD